MVLVVVIVPVARRSADREGLRAVARRFGLGTLLALGVLVGTGTALAFHLRLWGDGTFEVKLALVLILCALLAWHVRRPDLHTLEATMFLLSLAIVWIGLYLANGYY